LGTVYEIFICVVCVGALPIVNVSIFINMSPVFAVLLAIWVIGEKLTAFNAVQVAASFVGVVLIILGRETAPG
jgi:drug/metabolite transporter (DMT)-like permease